MIVVVAGFVGDEASFEKPWTDPLPCELDTRPTVADRRDLAGGGTVATLMEVSIVE